MITLLFALGLFTVAIILVFCYSHLLFVDPDNYHEVLRNVVLSIAALVSLPFVIWRAQANDISSKASHRQSQTAIDSQINDRFTRAVEQLGSDNLTIRIGGVHALGKIAEDSPRDAQTIIDILCSFVRAQTNHIDYKEAIKNDEGEYHEPRMDIQDSINVIGRDVFAKLNKNLEYAYLPKVRMIELNLTATNFGEAYLHGAIFYNSVFDYCDFYQSDLSQLNCSKSNFLNPMFIGINMEYARFAGTTFNSIIWGNSKLVGVTFQESELNEVHFQRVNFLEAVFNNSKIRESDFIEVENLTEKQFVSVDIDGYTKFNLQIQNGIHIV